MDLEITQKLLSVADVYEVRRAGSPELLMTVRGKVMTFSPNLTMIRGADGPELGALVGNALNSSFVLRVTGRDETSTLTFPTVSLKGRLTLQTGGREITGDGGVSDERFVCKAPGGAVVLEVAMLPVGAWGAGAPLGHAAKFSVRTPEPEALSPELATLVAVAIHQKYF
ncbi:MAG: hypothetical protein ACHREM_03020 [Polyangiales bacterium]